MKYSLEICSFTIQLFPIIRPRSLDYFYDNDEWQIVIDDIRMCRNLGCDGISVGVQKVSGQIDADRMKQIAEIAYPMEINCNRAFDAVPDPFEALEVLINAGCRRVLTSGLAETAPQGAGLHKQLVEQAHINKMTAKREEMWMNAMRFIWFVFKVLT